MKKVMIGMSGGVDSSVAALRLQQEGYDVTGVTLKLFGDEDIIQRRTPPVPAAPSGTWRMPGALPTGWALSIWYSTSRTLSAVM